MKNLMAIIAALAITLTATLLPAAEGEVESYLLKDGSVLIVRADGTMKMVDKNCEKIQMAEDVPMELEDGSIIMMRLKHIWKRVGPPGKGIDIHKQE